MGILKEKYTNLRFPFRIKRGEIKKDDKKALTEQINFYIMLYNIKSIK